MAIKGNPARRLYEIILESEKVYKEFKQQSQPSVSIWIVWAKVFDIEINNSREKQIETISRINQSRKLVDEVEYLLLKNEDIDHEKYLRPFPKLRDLFVKPFDVMSSFNSFFKINGSDITILEFCIDAVSKVYKEKVIDENELKEVLIEIQNLYEQIIDSDIEKTLKRILLDMLKIMENAIHEYRIRGIERFHEAIEQLIGIYVVNEEKINQSKDVQVKKVRTILSKFGSLYSFAADTVQLLGAGEIITKFLGQ